MPVPLNLPESTLVRARDLHGASDRPADHLLVFRLGGFRNYVARKPMVEFWAFSCDALPVGAGFAMGAAEERVEAFYVPARTRVAWLACMAEDGYGPRAVTPEPLLLEEGTVEVWEHVGCEKPTSGVCSAGATSLSAHDVPVGGWVWQGMACERIRPIAVRVGSPEHRMAVSNSSGEYAARLRARFAGAA